MIRSVMMIILPFVLLLVTKTTSAHKGKREHSDLNDAISDIYSKITGVQKAIAAVSKNLAVEVKRIDTRVDADSKKLHEGMRILTKNVFLQLRAMNKKLSDVTTTSGIKGLREEISSVKEKMSAEFKNTNLKIDTNDHNAEKKIQSLQGDMQKMSKSIADKLDETNKKMNVNDGKMMNDIRSLYKITATHTKQISGGILDASKGLLKIKSQIDHQLTHLHEEIDNAKATLGNQLTQLNEKVAENTRNINAKSAELESEVISNTDKINTNIADIDGLNTAVSLARIYFPEGSKSRWAQRFYPLNHKAAFVGYGVQLKYDDYHYHQTNTFNDCLQYCYRRRTVYPQFNGLTYDWTSGSCNCVRNDEGHVIRRNRLHYRFK